MHVISYLNFLLYSVHAALIKPQKQFQHVGSRAEIDCSPEQVGMKPDIHGTIRVMFMELSVKKSDQKRVSLAKYDTQQQYTGVHSPNSRWNFMMPNFFMSEPGEELPEISAIIRKVTCDDEGLYKCVVRFDTASGSTVTLEKMEQLKCIFVARENDPMPEHQLVENPGTINIECCKDVVLHCNPESISLPNEIKKGVYQAILYRRQGSPNSMEPIEMIALANFKEFNGKSWRKTIVSHGIWEVNFPTFVEANHSTLLGYPRDYLFIRAVNRKPTCNKDKGTYFCRITFDPNPKAIGDTWEGSQFVGCSGPQQDENTNVDKKPFHKLCIFDFFSTCCDLICFVCLLAGFSVLILCLTILKIIFNRIYNVITIRCDHRTTIKSLIEIMKNEPKVHNLIKSHKLDTFVFFNDKIAPENELDPHIQVFRFMTKIPLNVKNVKMKIKLVKSKKRKILYSVIFSVTPLETISQVEPPPASEHTSSSHPQSHTGEYPIKLHLRKSNPKATEISVYGTPV